MGASLEYQMQDLTGSIEKLGQSFPSGGKLTKDGGEVAGSVATLKQRVKYFGGLVLLVSLGVVGIPFLIYFVIRALAVVLG